MADRDKIQTLSYRIFLYRRKHNIEGNENRDWGIALNYFYKKLYSEGIEQTLEEYLHNMFNNKELEQ